MEQQYYVQDKRSFHGNAVIWWGIDGKGYTSDINQAGKYSLDYFNGDRRSSDVLWPCEYIDDHEKAKIQIIDMQYLDTSKSIK